MNSPLEHGENPPDSLIPDSLIHGFTDSQIQNQNTKASASPTHSQNNSQSQLKAKPTPTSPSEKKNGRPVLPTEQVEWIQRLAKHLGFENMTPRDYSIAVQWAEKTGWDMEAFRHVLAVREAGGIESFRSIGDVFSAAIGCQQNGRRTQ